MCTSSFWRDRSNPAYNMSWASWWLVPSRTHYSTSGALCMAVLALAQIRSE